MSARAYLHRSWVSTHLATQNPTSSAAAIGEHSRASHSGTRLDGPARRTSDAISPFFQLVGAQRVGWLVLPRQPAHSRSSRSTASLDATASISKIVCLVLHSLPSWNGAGPNSTSAAVAKEACKRIEGHACNAALLRGPIMRHADLVFLEQHSGLLGEDGAVSSLGISKVRFAWGRFSIFYPDTTLKSH